MLKLMGIKYLQFYAQNFCLSKPMRLPLLPEIQQALIPAFTFGQTGSCIKSQSLSDPSLAQTEIIEIPITLEPPEEPTTDVRISSQVRNTFPILGLTVPLLNTFSGTGKKSPLTNITSAWLEDSLNFYLSYVTICFGKFNN